jgi:predicted PurR-regulated permease PerM
MASEETNKRFKIEPLLGGFAFLLILVGCFFVLRPFMTALMWAIILSYALHPLQRIFTRWFRGSRTLAACFVTLTVTLALAGPIVLIGFSIAQDGKDLAHATRNWVNAAPDQAPAWVDKVPVVGNDIAGYWAKFAEERKPILEQLDKEVKTLPLRPKIVMEGVGGQTLMDAPATPVDKVDGKIENNSNRPDFVALLGNFLTWAWSALLSVTVAVGQGVTQLALSGFLAFFLLKDADILSGRLSVAADRLAGDRGALVAGLGFWIAGVPGAVLLSVLTFFFAVIPFGPPLIWIPASLWLFAQDKPGLGIFLFLWGVFGISSVDNFLRPYLISQGSKMPFVLIFCGVIGGALAFGLVGVFLGPTLLAVAFRLIEEWSSYTTPLDEGLIVESSSELQGKAGSGTPLHGGESLGVR